MPGMWAERVDFRLLTKCSQFIHMQYIFTPYNIKYIEGDKKAIKFDIEQKGVEIKWNDKKYGLLCKNALPQAISLSNR